MKAINKLILLSVVLFSASCAEPDYPEAVPVVTSLTSKLTVVHVIPEGPRVKVKIDNRITPKDTLRFEKAPDGKFYNTITLAVPAGPNRLINIANYEDEKDLAVDRYNATASTNNTSFISTRDNKVAVIRVADDLSVPDVGFSKLRFFNFSPNVGEIRITDIGGAATIFAARLFNQTSRTTGSTTTDFSRFTTMPAGTYSFEVRSVPGNEILYTINNLKIDSKNIYTLYLKGLSEGVGNVALAHVAFKH